MDAKAGKGRRDTGVPSHTPSECSFDKPLRDHDSEVRAVGKEQRRRRAVYAPADYSHCRCLLRHAALRAINKTPLDGSRSLRERDRRAGTKGRSMTSPPGPTLKGSKRVPFTCLGSLCPSTCCGPFQGTKALQAVLTTDDLGSALPHEPSSPVEGVSIFAQIRLTPDDIERLQTAGLDRMIVYRGDAVKPNESTPVREHRRT